MVKINNTQFQSLSRCESISMAYMVTRELSNAEDHGFRKGLKEAYDHANKVMSERGIKVVLTYDVALQE